MFCSHCGSRLEEDAVYCHSCGRPAKSTLQENDYIQQEANHHKTQNCSHCGTEQIDGSIYCHSCGSEVKETDVAYQPIHQHVESTPIEHFEGKKGTVFVSIGWPFFGLALTCFILPTWVPILFGLVSLIMGILVFKVRSHTHGIILIIASVLGTIASVGIGHVVRTLIEQYYY